MPLNRTWYNSLVDDDGSTTVGSVWNKASVDHIYDDVDAEVPTRWAVYDPPWVNSVTGATVIPGQNSCRWFRVSNIVFLSIYTNGLTVAADTHSLKIGLPPGLPPLVPSIEQFVVRTKTTIGPSEWGSVRTYDGTQAEVWRQAEQNWVVGVTFAVFGQGFYLL